MALTSLSQPIRAKLSNSSNGCQGFKAHDVIKIAVYKSCALQESLILFLATDLTTPKKPPEEYQLFNRDPSHETRITVIMARAPGRKDLISDMKDLEKNDM